MIELVWLIPALPLAGFLLLLFCGRRIGEPGAGWLATLLMGGAFAATVAVHLGLVDRVPEERAFVQTLFQWLPVGGLHVDVGFLVDPLSMTMALFITGVGALIHLYSIGYMHGDRDYARYFALLNLFVFFMLVLVLGDSLLITFLGWEGVGLCSYQLISFWFTEMPNAVAGKKAFVTNRIGDWGFLVAMFFTFTAVGSLNYIDLNSHAATMATTTATAIAFLLFVGAVGKSAQVPLFVWLPDAMAGPTPVSALIHAATMVTAGVFLMIRVNPVLYASSDWVPDLIAWIGVGTALLAATIAVAQNDIKKVLAYSTISQLGYTFLAVGSGAYVAALFHVVTHAFFKALLFLGSGSVIHGMHDEQDMRRMGALRKVMPITAATFIVGWLAIAGVPPFAGFWSKDEILAHAFDNSPALWALGLLTALLTAFYMSRQVFLVFFGEARWQDHLPGEDPDEPRPEIDPHESPWTMTLPLVVLAVLAAVGGLINLPFLGDSKLFENWLEPVVHGSEAELTLSAANEVALAVISVVAALLGIALAVAIYLRKRVKPVEPEVLAHAWYIDETIAQAVDGPGEAAFEGTAAFDRVVIDGAVNGTGSAIWGLGERLRVVQTGFVRSYALAIALGAVALMIYVVTRIS
ncbi:MAG TPA: NADH-quinone oxidoreductase subunit L [Acidimicrobiales bacterium]